MRINNKKLFNYFYIITAKSPDKSTHNVIY
nr:MAG TPA: major outer capsid protein [Caudoviricetes sp.]